MQTAIARRTTAVASLAILAGFGLLGCANTASSEPAPSVAKYLEGDWQCLTTSEDGAKDNEYTYHLRVEASHISIGQAKSGEDLYWSQYDYSLSSDNVLVTMPEVGGTGWTVQLPDEVTYADQNDVRIEEESAQNLEVALTPSSATWVSGDGQHWSCQRGKFEDDGNTFVKS